MAEKNFFKDNFVLIVGIALPVILMLGFMVAAVLPQSVANPPKYDVLFYTQDYNNYTRTYPVNVSFVVRDGVLKARYEKIQNGGGSYYWLKLYRFEASTQQVREIPFVIPEGLDQKTGTWEEAIEETKNLKLDTNSRSPDGYELTNESYRHGGLINEVLWDFGGRSNETRLRNGPSSVKLTPGQGLRYTYANNATFIGWVKQ